MPVKITAYDESDIKQMIAVWNEVVRDGKAFPQTEELDEETGALFFSSQTVTETARKDDGEIVGLYILHPNNVGRCGHICNCSYAVKGGCRGLGTGEKLVRRSIEAGREKGFRILQFNAVVASNKAALALYEKLGFTRLGVIPGGFRLDDGSYADIIPHYISLL